MGVGVSYTGYDGAMRHASVSGVEEMRSVFGESGSGRNVPPNDAEGILSKARRPKRQLEMFGDVGSGDKVLPGGSVVGSPNGLCLRGEEQSPLIEGRKVFASVNGRKGFFALTDIDPATRGALVGIGDRRDQEMPDESSKDEPDGNPWSITFTSRLCMKEVEDAKLFIVYEFYREMYFSAAGRITGVSGERQRVVGQIRVTDAGGGKFEVRPVFSDVVGQGKAIDYFLFGDSKLLAGDDLAEIEKRDGVSRVDVVVHGGIS